MGLTRYVHAFWALLLLSLPLSLAQAETARAGGQGVLKVTPNLSMHNTGCLKIRSETIVEVCAEYTIKWKMWALMGEPVGNYVLAWKLASVSLKDLQHSNGRIVYSPDRLPPELRAPAKALQLYIDGVSVVGIAGGRSSSSEHRFNTGVAVRAGADSSFNVPGSPSWGKLFVTSGDACVEKRSTYMDAASAKALFAKGIELYPVRVCPGSEFFELGALEAAIAKLCDDPAKANQYGFCHRTPPKKKEAAATTAIGDAFAALEKEVGGKQEDIASGDLAAEFTKLEEYRVEQERLRREEQIRQERLRKEEEARQARRVEYTSTCQSKYDVQQNCLIGTCKAEPNKTICTKHVRDERPPSRCESKCYVFDTFSCVATAPNPAYAEWETCNRNLAQQCAAQGQPIASVDACVSQMEATYQRANVRREILPATEPTLLEEARKKARELGRCKPEAGEKCPPRKNRTVGGVRG